MQLAFYKAKGNWIDYLVRLRTGSKYSHCELIIGSLWISSSSRDGGVRIKRIETDLDHWDYIDVNFDSAKAIEVFCRSKGMKYDYLGVLVGRLFRTDIQTANRYFCAELVGEMIGIEHPYRLTPQSLFERFSK